MRKSLQWSWIGVVLIVIGLFYPICLVVGLVIFVIASIIGQITVARVVDKLDGDKK